MLPACQAVGVAATNFAADRTKAPEARGHTVHHVVGVEAMKSAHNVKAPQTLKAMADPASEPPAGGDERWEAFTAAVAHGLLSVEKLHNAPGFEAWLNLHGRRSPGRV